MVSIKHISPLSARDIIFLFFVAVFMANLLWKYEAQSRDHLAVLIQPMAYDTVNPSRVYVHWNMMTTKDHTITVQFDTDASFMHPVTICENVSGYECTANKVLEPDQRYYVRNRTEKENQMYPWSPPRIFFTGPFVPTNALSDFE